MKKKGQAELLDVTAEQAFKIVEDGEKEFNVLVGENEGTARPDFHTYLHPLLTGDAKIGEQKHLQFSRLTTLHKEWNGKEPIDGFRYPNLKFGSVIRIDKTRTGSHALPEGYYLYMQPLCDAVRIKSGGAPFVFVKLKKSEAYFDFIVKDYDATYSTCELRLRLAEKHPIIITPNFKPKANQDVIESNWDPKEKRIVFYLTGDRTVSMVKEKNIIFGIADLKSDYAQRLSHRFATQLSRIGLDEFEWQRRFARPKV